jgi:GTP-binding protein Era
MKTGYIAITGNPNVGKSTLLNKLLQFKLSIISSKPQTTRNRILGILTENECQCCFIDTPGLITPRYILQEEMIKEIKHAVSNADIILWVIDPWFNSERIPLILEGLVTSIPVVCVINKIDLVSHSQLLPLIDSIKEYRVADIIPVSALFGEGIEELKTVLFRLLPEGPFLYPEENMSDAPERFFVAEIIRERIFETFKNEIPYSTCVVIDEFKERDKGKDYIKALIYVERPSQRQILIGKKGAALKNVGKEARKGIEEFLGRSVYLELWVKIKEKWRKNKKFLKEIGY